MTEQNARSAGGPSLAATVPWLLSAKVAVPKRVDAYFSRPRLFEWTAEAESRMVVVLAPGGFGKTTVLAEVHRSAAERGVLAAWLTLDEDDTVEGIGTYLAYAFEKAGLRSPSASEAIDHGLALVARSVEDYGGPCLLVLDEVERIAAEAVPALDFLLRHRPDNLSVAMAMRENPGLDLTPVTLNGRGLILTADQLRFSRQEIVDFLGGDLSRREMAEATARTEGWPVALRLYRNMRADQAASTRSAAGWPTHNLPGDEGIAANWLGARLLRSVSAQDRDFLLDLSLFDWIDLGLVDGVFGREDSRPRTGGMLSLRGLIQPMGGDGETLRLHPLLKDYCAAQLQREDPDRYRWLHREIAIAMEGRGHLLPSIRHASAAGDSRLVGDILERAGGLRLYVQEGSTRLGAVERFLTPDVYEGRPRLALLRCRILTNDARLAEARSLYENVRVQTNDFTRDPNVDSNHALRVDATIMQSILAGFGCMPVTGELIRDVETSLSLVEQEDEPDPATLAVHNVILFIAHYQAARFDLAREFAAEARKQYARCGSYHGDLYVTLHIGLLAMAQGRGEEARRNYDRARRIAADHFPHDAGHALVLDVLSTEVELECNRTEELETRLSQIPIPLRDVAVLIDVRAAALEMTAERKLDTGDVEGALQAIEESRDFALSHGLVGAERHLSALRVAYLVEDGRIDQAAREWRGAGLPSNLPDMFDTNVQSWREVEAISLARIRLLEAQGEAQRAREVAVGLCAMSGAHGMMRTYLRCLAAWMAMEYRADRQNDAATRLLEYLSSDGATDYIRPLVREREATTRVLETLMGMDLRGDARELASALPERLGATMTDDPVPETQRYTAREIEVLDCLGKGMRDKEIAGRLGITANGVRYHLKNIFRKLGVSGRIDAVTRARSAGVIRTRATETRSGNC